MHGDTRYAAAPIRDMASPPCIAVSFDRAIIKSLEVEEFWGTRAATETSGARKGKGGRKGERG